MTHDSDTPMREDGARAWTPGPWLVQFEQGGGYAVWTRQPHIGTLATIHEEDINGEFPAKANARLIAAAPDLYEALDRFCSALDGADCDYDELAGMARAALAKAREGSPS